MSRQHAYKPVDRYPWSPEALAGRPRLAALFTVRLRLSLLPIALLLILLHAIADQSICCALRRPPYREIAQSRLY